jgi:hypothetical protein
MRKTILLALLIIALTIMGGTVVSADPPEAHQAITDFTGPETCAMCHPDAAREVAESVHYQQQAIPKFREGWPEGEPGGMYTTY